MKVYVTRHAHAVSAEENPDRPLSDRGCAESKKVAAAAAAAGAVIGRAIHAKSLRAQQTAEVFADMLGATDVEALDAMAGDGDPMVIADMLNGSATDTLVTGHLPLLERLIEYLTTGNADGKFIALEQGDLVCLEKRDDGDGWRLAWYVNLALLG